MNKLGKLFNYLTPPENWKLPVTITLGIFTGLALLVFHIANGTSYLSDNPETCVNCHVMFPQFASWQHSSHARVATCNDCHVPHDNIFSKFFFKAKDGLRHTTIFTLRLEPQVIHIKEAGQEVVHENCERCHEGLMGYVHSAQQNRAFEDTGQEDACWKCHQEVPHGTVSSLSAFPNAGVPKLSPVVPEWIDKELKNNK